MKKIILILILLVFIIGCAEKECETNEGCPIKTCFTAKCKENKCVLSPVSDCCGNKICEINETYPECVVDCPNCDDVNECTKDEYDYHEQKCVNTIIPNVICCGNSLCETEETYSNCARDCPNCDDKNDCTVDEYDYHEQTCINELIVPCCGNDICDEGVEDYSSCSTDCPDCDDKDKLTTDIFNYETQKCENIELLIEKDIGDYKYVEYMYDWEGGQLRLYSKEGEQIGTIKGYVALYKNSIGQDQGAFVYPYDNRQDVINSLEGLSIDMGFVSGEYKGEKVYRIGKELIFWTNNAYILASGTEPDSSGVPPAEVIIDAYLKKYPNDLE